VLDDLEPAVRTALMKILSAIYETGMVDAVQLGDVLRLFGVPKGAGDEAAFSFHDESWVEAYVEFKEQIGEDPYMLLEEEL